MQPTPATTLSSLLDNDFYKFTMQFAVIHLFPKAKAKYTFINRGKHIFLKALQPHCRNVYLQWLD